VGVDAKRRPDYLIIASAMQPQPEGYKHASGYPSIGFQARYSIHYTLVGSLCKYGFRHSGRRNEVPGYPGHGATRMAGFAKEGIKWVSHQKMATLEPVFQLARELALGLDIFHETCQPK